MSGTGHDHPEELLALADKGALSADQRELLREHLAECPACSVLVSARSAFARELEEQPGDSERNRRAVERALVASGLPVVRRGTRARSIWLGLAAAAILSAGLAAAGSWLTNQPLPNPGALRVEASQRAPSGPPPTPSGWRVPSQAPPPIAATPGDALLTPQPRELAPTRKAPDGASAAELFQRASELRRRGASSEALAVYRDLQARFASSSEAKLSSVIAGRLLMDQNQHLAALAQFTRYLNAGGPATEEALVGSATALERLSRKAEERQSWSRLLRQFPQSVHAERARARLRALSGSDVADGVP